MIRRAKKSDLSETNSPSVAWRSSDLVQALYRGLLNREPDSAGLAAWQHLLDAGTPLQEVVAQFDSTPERDAVLRKHRRPVTPAFNNGPPITIVDVGAQPLVGEDDIFRPLLESGQCHVIGVEPLESTHHARLSRDPTWRLLPFFLGDGSERTFYETSWGPTSSLYEPNHDGLSDFVGLSESCLVSQTKVVQTVRLDDLVEEPVDLLKIDVQGAELDVLHGAEKLLDEILVIHVEVQFFPLYRGVPLFDRVFSFMLDHAFELFDFPRLERYEYQHGTGYLERLLWADALFIPSRMRLEQLDENQRLKLNRIMNDVYGAAGFCRWLRELTPVQNDSSQPSG